MVSTRGYRVLLSFMVTKKISVQGPDSEKIDSLVTALPILKDIFDIHYKVGEGTFSSVFLATLKSSRENKKFAIKYLTATYPPSRLERELSCLQEIGYKNYAKLQRWPFDRFVLVYSWEGNFFFTAEPIMWSEWNCVFATQDPLPLSCHT